MFLSNMLGKAPVAPVGNGDIYLEYITNAINTGNGAVHTYTGVSTGGTATIDTIIIAAVGQTVTGTTAGITGITLDGVSMTELFTRAATGRMAAGLFKISGVAATSATIVVTYNNTNPARGGIGVYRVIGGDVTLSNSDDNYTALTATTFPTTVNIGPWDSAISFGSLTDTVVYGNTVEDFDVVSETYLNVSGARVVPTADTRNAYTITATMASSNTDDGVFTAVLSGTNSAPPPPPPPPLVYSGIYWSLVPSSGAYNGLYIKSDGLKLYIIRDNKMIDECSMSPAWDITSVSWVAAKDFSATSNGIYGFTFSSDGTRLLLTNSLVDELQEWVLSTAWDITTATDNAVSLSVVGQDPVTRELKYNTDGTKLYMVGGSSGTIYQYTLTTPYTLSTCTYAGISLYVGSQDPSPRGLDISSDGLTLYMCGLGSGSIHKYTLSTGWLVSSATYDGAPVAIPTGETLAYGLALNAAEDKLFLVGDQTSKIYQYTIS
jgi:hypothetical protein